MNTKMFRRGFRHLAWAATLIIPLSACSIEDVLKVNDPDTVNPGTLQDPRALQQVINGAIRDFQDAYSSGESYVTISALMADEFYSTGTFTTRTATDRRNQFPIENGNTSDGTYTSMQFARRGLKDAFNLLADSDRGTSDPDYALLRALRGYTYVLLAEGYCGYLAFSEVEEGEYVYGTPITATAALEASFADFDAAISGGSNLGRVGKARALLNLGRAAEAAQVVSSVPTTWVYYVEHSSSSSVPDNAFFGLQANGRYSMGQNEGVNGLPFRAPAGGDDLDPANADPRVPWINSGPGFDPGLGDVYMAKYFTFDDDFILADGVEARLIQAEAELASGGDWLGTLNELRADAADLIALRTSRATGTETLDPLTDPGSDPERVKLIMSERAFWMWGTGHRLGDLRRMVRNYGSNAESVYPSGAYHKGGVYGTDVVNLVDFDESNNPEYDLNLCVPNSAS